METPLDKFYAVTCDADSGSISVYEALISQEQCNPVLTKLALKGTSSVKEGAQISTGSMLCIMKWLQLFVPEGSGVVSQFSTVQRDAAQVNTTYWGGHTSAIAALFLEKESALTCFNESPQPRDQRWRTQTLEVLRALGVDHPKCSISTTSADYWLFPPSAWEGKILVQAET